MGMAATQARLLQLTSELNDLEFQARLVQYCLHNLQRITINFLTWKFLLLQVKQIT